MQDGRFCRPGRRRRTSQGLRAQVQVARREDGRRHLPRGAPVRLASAPKPSPWQPLPLLQSSSRWEGGVCSGPLPPFSGEFRPIYDRLIAEGVVPEPCAPPAPPPPRVTCSQLIADPTDADPTDADPTLTSTAKPRDLWSLRSRGSNVIPATNPKVGRLAAKAGISAEAWFARIA